MSPNRNIACFAIRGREGMSFDSGKGAACFDVEAIDPVLVFAVRLE
jgi:hypothetical protein